MFGGLLLIIIRDTTESVHFIGLVISATEVGREPEYADGPATSEIMQAWVHQMLDPATASGRFPLALDVESVYCQWEACVIRKAGGF